MHKVVTISAVLLVTLTACNGETTVRAGMTLEEAQQIIDSAEFDTSLMAGARLEADGTAAISNITLYKLDESTGFRLLISESNPAEVGAIEVVHGLGGFKSDYVFESRTELVVP